MWKWILWQLRVDVNAYLKKKLKTEQKALVIEESIDQTFQVPVFLVCLPDDHCVYIYIFNRRHSVRLSGVIHEKSNWAIFRIQHFSKKIL